MRKLVIEAIAAVMLTITASAAGAQVNWDQGPDASAFLDEARASSWQPPHFDPILMGGSTWSRDCKEVVFRADSPLVSEKMLLVSQETIMECAYRTPPCFPPYQYCRGPIRDCWPRPGGMLTGWSQITLRRPQGLYKWEQEKFRLCMVGNSIDVFPMETAYEYKVIGIGMELANFTLEAGKRIPTSPDPKGIELKGLSSRMIVSLKDIWSKEYLEADPSGQTQLRVTIKKESSHRLLLDQHNIDMPKDCQVDLNSFGRLLSEPLELNSEYSVKIWFRRLGKLSKPDWQSLGESEPVKYQP